MVHLNSKEISIISKGNLLIVLIARGSLLLWEAVNSSFGKGYWLNYKAWVNENGWRNK